MLPATPRKSTSKTWWTYIVLCADDTFYTGITVDVQKRIEKHNSGDGAKYTKNRKPVVLVYSEKHPDRSCASKRENQIKRLTRKQKEDLLAGSL